MSHFFLRRLAMALPVMVMVSMPPSAALADSTMTLNGITFSVKGGDSQSVSAIDGGIDVEIDGRRITVTGETATVDGKSYDIGPFQSITIDLTQGNLILLADDKPVVEEGPLDVLAGKAESGDADAMNRLGNILLVGQELPRDPVRAAALFEKAAAAGHIAAARNLAYMLLDGRDLPADNARALALAQQAADAGDSVGQRLLGFIHADGRGVPVDPELGMSWYQKAADQGDNDAMYFLGNAYRYGRGVPQDLNRSTELFKQASEGGHSRAHCSYAFAQWEGRGIEKDRAGAFATATADLGAQITDCLFVRALGHYFGEGTEKSSAEAARWFWAAANKGDGQAARNLAILYRTGDGLPQDDFQARHWFQTAINRGVEQARAELDGMNQ